MGAENSKLVASRKEKENEKRTTRNQYHDAKNTKYIESTARSLHSVSSESSTSSPEDSTIEERKDTKPGADAKRREESPVALHPTRVLEGLSQEEKTRKSEEILKHLWKHPPVSWEKITEVTAVSAERTVIDGQVADEVRKEVDHEVDKIIYDVPLDHCHLKVPKNRTMRSCPDPWRRHGAHLKLCEIGGTMPENRNRNAKSIPIAKGSNPPPAPKTKPLRTMDDYMKLMRK